MNRSGCCFPDLQENNISLYSEDSSVVGILNDIKSMLENTPANADTLRHLFSGEAFKLMLKEALGTAMDD